MANVKKNKKQSSTGTTVLIVALSLILVIAIFFAFNSDFSFSSVGTITTTVVESKMTDDGETRNVKATYSVDVDKSKVTNEDVQRVATETMSSFTYDQLTGDNAMENLKDATRNNLEMEFGMDSIEGVYLSEFNTNAPEESSSGVSESQERRNEIMKGLFPNMN